MKHEGSEETATETYPELIDCSPQLYMLFLDSVLIWKKGKAIAVTDRGVP
jgi:hypothetical protein